MLNHGSPNFESRFVATSRGSDGPEYVTVHGRHSPDAVLFQSWPSRDNIGRRFFIWHFHEPGHFHELTFSCYRRLPLLTKDDWRRRLCKCIDAAGEKSAVELVGFVLMPEHIQQLVYPLTDSETGNIPDYLSQLKEPFSKEVKQLLTEAKSPLLKRLTVRERPGKTCFRFWQEGPGFDRNGRVLPTILPAGQTLPPPKTCQPMSTKQIAAGMADR